VPRLTETMRALIRFGLTGILATITHVMVFVLLVEFIHWRPVFASVPAFAVAVGVSYFLNYRWTFTATGPHRVLLPRFIVVSVTGLCLNLLITYLFVDVWGLWYGLALLAIIIVIPLSTYLLSRFWVFQR
jgi:putative flippase GtrA